MTHIIFGGTAAYHLTLSEFTTVGERCIVDTPFGQSAPFVQLTIATTQPRATESVGVHGSAPESTRPDAQLTVWFSSRHGEDGLQRSAAFVNHRANIWAARELGATGIFSWNGVGAIAPGLAVGMAVVPDDLLDMTRARLATFGEAAVTLPAGSPFAGDLREKIVTACHDAGHPCATHGTYVCTEGPRLETAAEIALYGWGGAAVVGMTLAPEVWLAAELGIPYASLCIITNMATGRWQLDPRRDFGPNVGKAGLKILLAACAG